MELEARLPLFQRYGWTLLIERVDMVPDGVKELDEDAEARDGGPLERRCTKVTFVVGRMIPRNSSSTSSSGLVQSSYYYLFPA